MPGKLNVYGLGSLGVNVDKNPINLEDGELPKAQNAIHDPAGSMGGIRKRRGLIKHNSVAAAGGIKGAIGVPIGIGTAGNPIPAVYSGGGTGGGQSFFQGRRITSTTAGWNTTTDTWTTSPTTGGPDSYDAAATPRVPDYLWPGVAPSGDNVHHHYRAAYSGRPGVMYKNRFYYAGNDYTYQTTAPTIRMWDGSRDVLLCRIPGVYTVSSRVEAEAVIDMTVGGDGFIYLTVFMSGLVAANTSKGRVFQLNPDGGALVQIGSGFPISPDTYRFPYTIQWNQGRLWTRTMGNLTTGGTGLVYYIRPSIDTDWTLETTEAGVGDCNLMFSFQGQLYMAMRVDQNIGAYIRVRSPLGVYSTSKTAALNEGGTTPTIPINFGYGNHFGAAATFNGNVYVSYYDSGDTTATDSGDRFLRIYKFDGTTWTVVYAPAANDPDNLPYSYATVLQGKIFFVSPAERTSGAAVLNRMLYSSDGVSWSSVTTSILNDASGGILGSISG